MKFLAKLGLGALLLSTLSLNVAVAAPAYVETGTGFSLEAPKGWNTYVYNNVTIKINDRYSFVPETNNTIIYSDETGSAGIKFRHTYLRFLVNDKQLAKLGDWNLSVTYRWTAPTDSGSQKAGTLGTFNYRPAIDTKWGDMALKIRNGFVFPLNRRPYQVNVPTASAKGNTLFADSLEIMPSYDFGGGFSLGGIVNFIYKRMGKTPGGAVAAYNTYTFYHEWELDYSSPAINDYNIGLNISHNSDFGHDGAKIKFFSKAAELRLIVSKTF